MIADGKDALQGEIAPGRANPATRTFRSAQRSACDGSSSEALPRPALSAVRLEARLEAREFAQALSDMAEVDPRLQALDVED